MFCPLKMGHFIVESVVKPWKRKTISRGTLSQSISQTFFHINAQTASQCLVPERHWRGTEKILMLKDNCSQMCKWNKLSKFMMLFVSDIFIDLGYITKSQDMDQYVTSAEDGSYYCEICNQASRKKDNLRRHIESKHFPNVFSYQCSECYVSLGTREALQRHRQKCHPKN